jgi:Thioredoxin
MMKQIIAILFTLLTSYTMQAQTKIFKTKPDPKDEGSNMLVGQITAKDILQDGTCNWYKFGVEKYKTDSSIIKVLAPLLKKYTIIVVMGTWCEDTQQLFPAFYKTLQACKYDETKLEMIGVDRDKHALNIEHLLLKIEKVPTIIISDGAREIGRIVETISKENIETQLLYMIEKDIEARK